MRKSRLEKETIQQLVEHFVAGTPARATAYLCGIHRNTARKWYHQFRVLIVQELEKEHTILEGEVELDESYFGGTRKGKRGRGAAGKIAVFGIYKRNGYVHAVSVCDTKTCTLYDIIQEKVTPDSIVYTDSYKSYDVLDASQFRHYRINHERTFVEKSNHINGIENFWS